VIDKAAFAAHQLRRRLEPLLEKYLVEFPKVSVDHEWTKLLDCLNDQDPKSIIANLQLDRSVFAVELSPGSEAGRVRLDRFVNDGLSTYDELRNDPTKNGTSSLSAYLHFGQLSAQRVALEIHAHTTLQNEASAASYLDELITWREIAANYAFYNYEYGTFAGAPAWAVKSLEPHQSDPREFIYSYDEFKAAQTHDTLWNAAQLEMVRTGRMHGYMRMYWAKKILEWTDSPSQAVEIAVKLNDTYMLDGRDPNGYAGVMWAITGLHDRPWFDRPVYGQVRYMNANGAKSKFDVDAYIKQWGPR
jgi:deoxyribodipyrimidine photo-lyase